MKKPLLNEIHGLQKARRPWIGNIHKKSFFQIRFKDESTLDEKDYNWSDISHEIKVSMLGGEKKVKVCRYHIHAIKITHNKLNTEIIIPPGCQVYQAIRSETVFLNNGKKISNRIVGRVVGLVRDGEVIEERFIDELSNQVVGFRSKNF